MKFTRPVKIGKPFWEIPVEERSGVPPERRRPVPVSLPPSDVIAVVNGVVYRDETVKTSWHGKF